MVGLEWGAVENLVTLGVMPVGVADVKGYTNWVTAAKLDAAVKDVGTRGESSVDAIAALSPDLVITTTDESANSIAQFEKIAPVLVIRGADAANAIPQMKTNLELIGSAIGKTDQAKQVDADFDKRWPRASRRSPTRARPARASPWPTATSRAARSRSGCTPRLALGAVLTEMGLKNGWTGAGDKDYGLPRPTSRA